MSKSKILTGALIICLAALGVAGWFMFGRGAGMTYANAGKYTAGDTTVSSPVENLDINWTSGRVNIEYHAGDGVTVRETANRTLSEDDRIRWWLDGTTLRVQFCKPGFRFFVNLEKTLTVSLPEGTVLKTAGIRATSADLEIADLAAGEIVIETTSGDIRAATAAKQLKAGATSGAITLRQDASADSVGLSSTSGSISLTLADAKEVAVDATSGEIGVTMTGSADSVRLHSTSGTVRADLASADRADLSSTSGGVDVSLAAFKELKVGSTSGDVTAHLTAEPGFSGRLSTTSGSVSSELALEKNGNTYACGDGSAQVDIGTTSGSIRLLKR